MFILIFCQLPEAKLLVSIPPAHMQVATLILTEIVSIENKKVIAAVEVTMMKKDDDYDDGDYHDHELRRAGGSEFRAKQLNLPLLLVLGFSVNPKP